MSTVFLDSVPKLCAFHIHRIRMPEFIIVVEPEESPEDERWRWQFVLYTVDGALLVVARRQSPQVAQTHHIGVVTAGTP